jgi:deoxyribodipyrimidine photo-lyase
MTEYKRSLHWFRHDLRLGDNPALLAAMRAGETIALFIPDAPPHRPRGAASNVWLHQALASLLPALAASGIPLYLRQGDPAKIIPDFCRSQGIGLVTANRRYEAAAIAEEKAVERVLQSQHKVLDLHGGNLLHDPLTHRTNSGGPYQVYTPFWRSVLALTAPRRPLPAPKPQTTTADIAAIMVETRRALADLLPPQREWINGMLRHWQAGTEAAQRQLSDFLHHRLAGYKDHRNRPDLSATSRLSPHLAFGEISPYQIWHAAQDFCLAQGLDPLAGDSETFLKELCWREFSYHLLVHFPKLPTEPLRPQFKNFPWAVDAAGLRAWQRGQTGYPIIDAGMRELWQTGWMHNRVRMITASFLIKDLLLPWQEGEAWFWDTLVDADCANNAASWQWVAGCGADAAPYFRIFNPVLQAEKFDPNGDYVRRYVPELARLPNTLLHQPWQATPMELQQAGIVLGKNYPNPIVDHGAARKRALAALASIGAKAASA